MLVLELFEGEIPPSDDLNASVKANLKTEQVLNPLEFTKDKIEDRENSEKKTDTKEFAEFRKFFNGDRETPTHSSESKPRLSRPRKISSGKWKNHGG